MEATHVAKLRVVRWEVTFPHDRPVPKDPHTGTEYSLPTQRSLGYGGDVADDDCCDENETSCHSTHFHHYTIKSKTATLLTFITIRFLLTHTLEMRLRQVLILSRDVARSTQFFQEGLGLKLLRASDTFAEFDTQSGAALCIKLAQKCVKGAVS